MKTVVSFFKKYWIIILVVLAAVLFVVNLFLKKPQGPSPTPGPVGKAASFGSLTPGVSTEADVASQLGSPVDTKVSGSQKVSDYKTTNQYRFHEVTFTNGKAQLIKEIVNTVDNKDVTTITSIFGSPTDILYNKNPTASFNLYVYPARGIAYLGHPDGTLLEVWYFQPTTIDDFINTWAPDYSPKPSTQDIPY